MSALAVVFSRAMLGLNAPLVTVETHLSFGMPGFHIVGLPEAAVRESRDRVRSALLNSRFSFPDKRITVNLAPADLPKGGSRFDLAIAIGILVASAQVQGEMLADYEFVGELALSGELRKIQGVFPFAMQTKKEGKSLFLPSANANEAGLIEALTVYPANHLLEVCAHLGGKTLIQSFSNKLIEEENPCNSLDIADVYGQGYAKRALEIAAAGNHSLLMSGSPGSGKTLLAHRLNTILPDLSEQEVLEVTAIHSIHGKNNHTTPRLLKKRPFRTPHHTCSNVALVGGGRPPVPGEISLAHCGVLFLDELPEFDRRVLETLREPLESSSITISRAGIYAQFPAHFQLIAAMNPCPCGYYGDKQQECVCSPTQIQRYHSRLSGPFLDRIDLQIEVKPIDYHDLISQSASEQSETSAIVKHRVIEVRKLQKSRCGKLNSQLGNQELNEVCELSTQAKKLLESALIKFKLSARGYHRIIRVARTIADLAGSQAIALDHISEALNFRSRGQC